MRGFLWPGPSEIPCGIFPEMVIPVLPSAYFCGWIGVTLSSPSSLIPRILNYSYVLIIILLCPVDIPLF